MTASIHRYRRVGCAHLSARSRGAAFTTAGFTLVEMLVVIAIISVLAALLLPAINMAREAARRAACSSNLRNLHLGIAQFEQAKSQFPASRTYWSNPAYPAKPATSVGTPVNFVSTPGAVLTWVHEIMPYIEKQGIRDQIEANFKTTSPVAVWFVPGGAGKLSIVLCPSDNTNEESPRWNNPNTGAPLPLSQVSYAVNTGVPDNNTVVGTPSSVITGVDWPQNGVFDNRLKGSGETTLKYFKTTLADVVNGDGAGSTIFLADNGDLEEWNYAPTEYHVGLVWDDANISSPIQIINTRRPWPVPGFPPNTKPNDLENLATTNVLQSPYCDAAAYARPLSNHPAGFMVAFCDGHTKFISDNIGYPVYAKLMTSNGKKYKSAGYTTVQSVNTPAASAQNLPLPEDAY